MLRVSRRLALSAAKASIGSHVSFDRAAGFRAATKAEHVAQGSNLDPTAIPVFVLPEVISAEEERALLHFTNGLFEPLSFADGHFDMLIEHYKEFYRSWERLTEEAVAEEMVANHSAGEPSAASGDAALVVKALRRAHDTAQEFLPSVPLQDRVHFLQLEPRGFIRPHADETRNSSGIVAGVTLGSGRVMSLTHPDKPEAGQIDMLLAPRSLYILAGTARNDWHHSVDAEGADPQAPEPGTPVMFRGEESGIVRERRTALIFRGLSPMELFMDRMAKKGGDAAGPFARKRQQ